VILYCDTSALIKRYVEEKGAAQVNNLWESASAVSTSVVAFAETMAVFSRKHKERVLSNIEYKEIVGQFKEDCRHLLLVPVSGALNVAIEDLLKRHPLRGFDAIHLASAQVFDVADNEDLLFACFDHALNNAAMKEGLKVITA